MDCLVVGDSIAVQYAAFERHCGRCAVGGWNSWQVGRLACARVLSADTIVVSLGSNDHKGVDTRSELMILRSRMQARRVFWILPAIKPHIQVIVREVAALHGDVVVTIDRTYDGVHPSMPALRTIREKINGQL